MLSSPHARKGELWRAFQKHYGRDDSRCLFLKASTLTMHTAFDAETVAEAMEDDPEAAAAEWGGSFRDDLEEFIGEPMLMEITLEGITELPPSRDHEHFGFVDAASGVGKDSITLAIAHSEADGEDGVALDHVSEVKPPFSPDAVVEEFAATLRRYRCSSVTGDRYSLGWVGEAFERQRITYEFSPMDRSTLYGNLLPLITRRRCVLLDHPKLRRQLCGLERRVGSGGRVSVDHPSGGHDDLANAVAGALVLAPSSVFQGGYSG